MDAKIVLEEFLVQSMGGSRETGKVHLRIKHGGQCYQGFGVEEDIVMASVKAYVNALNKIMAFKVTKPMKAKVAV